MTEQRVQKKYEIPEKVIIARTLEKMSAEIDNHHRSPFFDPVACKLMASSNEFYDLCEQRKVDPLSLGAKGVPLYSGRNFPLNAQIGDSLRSGIGGIVHFVNDFVAYESDKVDFVVRDLTREQYEKINGKKWKDWDWLTFFLGRLGLPKYIHKTGLGVYNFNTTEEDIQEEVRNARIKGKEALREKFLGATPESQRVEEEGIKLVDYAKQIDAVIENYIHFNNLRPRK